MGVRPQIESPPKEVHTLIYLSTSAIDHGDQGKVPGWTTYKKNMDDFFEPYRLERMREKAATYIGPQDQKLTVLSASECSATRHSDFNTICQFDVTKLGTRVFPVFPVFFYYSSFTILA